MQASGVTRGEVSTRLIGRAFQVKSWDMAFHFRGDGIQQQRFWAQWDYRALERVEPDPALHPEAYRRGDRWTIVRAKSMDVVLELSSGERWVLSERASGGQAVYDLTPFEAWEAARRIGLGWSGDWRG